LDAADENTIIFEGILWRYMPGFAQHFYPKYCIVTKSAFVYFKSKYTAYNQRGKPLMSIALSDIGQAQRVQVDIPEEKQVVASCLRSKKLIDLEALPNFPKHQLEVFLREGGVTVQDAEDQKEETDLNAEEFNDLEDESLPVHKIPGQEKNEPTNEEKQIPVYSKPGDPEDDAEEPLEEADQVEALGEALDAPPIDVIPAEENKEEDQKMDEPKGRMVQSEYLSVSRLMSGEQEVF